jgi:hypothetical protein
MMLKFTAFLIFTGLSTIAAYAQDVELSVQPVTTEANQPATLRWKTKNATGVYITGLGKVGAEGAQVVHAAQTTDYTIFAEGKSGVVTKTVHLEIAGSKGRDEYPALDSFKFPVSSSHQPQSFTAFQDQVQRLLQDEMKLIVYTLPSAAGNFILVTGYQQRGDLVQPNETRIKARRISYFVEVEKDAKPGKGYGFTVKTRIEYQRKLESTWRPEEADAICRPEVDKLRERIDKLPQ